MRWTEKQTEEYLTEETLWQLTAADRIALSVTMFRTY
jgi:nitric oxide reductase large subunit